jgi:hypothetical protein
MLTRQSVNANLVLPMHVKLTLTLSMLTCQVGINALAGPTLALTRIDRGGLAWTHRHFEARLALAAKANPGPADAAKANEIGGANAVNGILEVGMGSIGTD